MDVLAYGCISRVNVSLSPRSDGPVSSGEYNGSVHCTNSNRYVCQLSVINIDRAGETSGLLGVGLDEDWSVLYGEVQ